MSSPDRSENEEQELQFSDPLEESGSLKNNIRIIGDVISTSAEREKQYEILKGQLKNLYLNFYSAHFPEPFQGAHALDLLEIFSILAEESFSNQITKLAKFKSVHSSPISGDFSERQERLSYSRNFRERLSSSKNRGMEAAGFSSPSEESNFNKVPKIQNSETANTSKLLYKDSTENEEQKTRVSYPTGTPLRELNTFSETDCWLTSDSDHEKRYTFLKKQLRIFFFQFYGIYFSQMHHSVSIEDLMEILNILSEDSFKSQSKLISKINRNSMEESDSSETFYYCLEPEDKMSSTPNETLSFSEKDCYGDDFSLYFPNPDLNFNERTTNGNFNERLEPSSLNGVFYSSTQNDLMTKTSAFQNDFESEVVKNWSFSNKNFKLVNDSNEGKTDKNLFQSTVKVEPKPCLSPSLKTSAREIRTKKLSNLSSFTNVKFSELKDHIEELECIAESLEQTEPPALPPRPQFLLKPPFINCSESNETQDTTEVQPLSLENRRVISRIMIRYKSEMCFIVSLVLLIVILVIFIIIFFIKYHF